ncbi:MAG TPA: hypothetical protein VHV81_03770 [Steroidobacteraceae bacterium]|jgi:hypothetical protein|nr:hypothetical protein [Steroidobacteraceae bacterium]
MRFPVGDWLRPALCVALGLSFLSGCAWFHHRKPPPPPTEIIVNGAPVDSVAFVDGAAAGQPVARGARSQILEVAPGPHKIEIHSGDKIVYREDTYVKSGERQIVSVLSGAAP